MKVNWQERESKNVQRPRKARSQSLLFLLPSGVADPWRLTESSVSVRSSSLKLGARRKGRHKKKVDTICLEEVAFRVRVCAALSTRPS